MSNFTKSTTAVLQDINPALLQYWANVADVGPILKKRLADAFGDFQLAWRENGGVCPAG